MKWPDMHDVIALWAAVSATAFVFFNPDIIADPQSLAWMYAIIGGLPVTGTVAVGAKRLMQGGSTAPEQIIKPVTPTQPQEDHHA